MNFKRILILGGTGMLGLPVVNKLTALGCTIRILTRNAQKSKELFGNKVEISEGSATNKTDLKAAMDGCDAVHVNLTPETEYSVMKDVIELAQSNIERISYVSATTLSEENRWFERVDMKLRTEELLADSGIKFVIFRPTWVMETLLNFIQGNRAIVVIGKNPPALHFFAAEDFGRIVADSFLDDRALGKRLYIYGPEAISLNDAMERFAKTCFPKAKVMRLKLWKAKLISKLLRNESLAEVTELLKFLDYAGEEGDPTETNALFGAPGITFEEWYNMPRDNQQGFPH